MTKSSHRSGYHVALWAVLSAFALGVVFCGKDTIEPSRLAASPASPSGLIIEHLFLRVEFHRGNPKVSIESDAIGAPRLDASSWPKALRAIRRMPDWEDFAAYSKARRDPRYESGEQLRLFDYLGYRGWHLAGVRLGADLPVLFEIDQTLPDIARLYVFTRQNVVR